MTQEIPLQHNFDGEETENSQDLILPLIQLRISAQSEMK